MGSESKGPLQVLQIDDAYEFCAPRFFDFMVEESEDEIKSAELWFEISQSYAPSPFMPKIREGRSVQVDSFCDFGSEEPTQKKPELASTASGSTRDGEDGAVKAESLRNKEPSGGKMSFEFALKVKPCETSMPIQEESSASIDICPSVPVHTSSKETTSFAFPILPSSSLDAGTALNFPSTATKSPTPKVQAVSVNDLGGLKKERTPEACTPKAQMIFSKGAAPVNSSKNQTATKAASVIKQQSGLKPKDHTPLCAQSSKSTKPKSVIKCPGSTNARNKAVAIDIAQENQAIKRQKLDDGRPRQVEILNIRNSRVLPHKSKPGSASDSELFASALRRENTANKEQAPYVSTAEMVNKFQSRTRDIELSQDKSSSLESTASMIQRRPKLKLTRPKEPELETAQRVRAVRVKSSAELEEEMLAKIPKFKARPVNKKILEALPLLPKSTPKPPEFQEFQLKTMERANQHAETSSVVPSVETSSQIQNKPCKLAEPRPPVLETSLRARPPKAKSSQELELEALEKIPKFKARPLNKKVLESKGDLGLYCIPKRQITTPQEFHFATDERLGPPVAVTGLFDKLSIHSGSSSRHERLDIPMITIPNPFHLHTEERGVEKERQLSVQILQKQLEDERARIHKANPYPYTTDYPVVPPKPEPKQCTKPEAFQLESLVRHEEEMQRKMEEKERTEREEAERRLFKAQPIMREDPIPLPERERKPLTDVQEFVLHVDHRAVERSEFDKKIKEKEVMYKRVRDEYESAKMMEEEKAVKQMRRTMVPHARPVPKFDNPFLPQKSMKDPTRVKSPKLHVKEREERRKHAFLR